MNMSVESPISRDRNGTLDTADQMFIPLSTVNIIQQRDTEHGPVLCEDTYRADEKTMLSGQEGVKFDSDKTRMELIPPELMEGVGAVLTFGANKYADRNWEKGMHWSRPFGALMRHMWAWWKGEKADPETGMSHLWHAGCCIAFLIAYEARNSGTDDRFKG